MSTAREITNDIMNKEAERDRLIVQDINRLAIGQAFETGYSPIGIGVIEFANVSTSIVTGTQTGT